MTSQPRRIIIKVKKPASLAVKFTPAIVGSILEKLSAQRKESPIEALNLVRAIKVASVFHPTSKSLYINLIIDHFAQARIPFLDRCLDIAQDWDSIEPNGIIPEYLLQCFNADVSDREYTSFFVSQLEGKTTNELSPEWLIKPTHLLHAYLFSQHHRENLVIVSLKSTVYHLYHEGLGLWLENKSQERLQEMIGWSLPLLLEKELEPLKYNEQYIEAYDSIMSKCMTCHYTRSVASFVKSMLFHPEIPSRFNSQIELLPTKVGVVNLRTGEYRQRLREDYFISASPVDYHPESKSVVIDKFLDDVTLGDTNLKECLQCIAGYCLTGSTRERRFFIFHGHGNNGKTSFMSMLQYVLGDLATVGDRELLIRGPKATAGAPSPHIMRLMGKRLLILNESEADDVLNEAQIKAFTSNGDKLTGRGVFCDSVEFTPIFKPILITNNIPNCSTDPAFWSRILLVPWMCHFTDEPKEGNERKIDRDFTERVLRSKLDMEAFLNWCIEGARKVLKGEFVIADIAKKATAKYRNAMDIVKEFIDGRCIVGPELRVKTNLLLNAYIGYCNTEGMSALGRNKFYAEITRRFGDKVQESGVWFFHGLRLR